MTIPEFLEKLAVLPYEWEIAAWPFDALRTKSEYPGDKHCPISAVTGDIADVAAPNLAAREKLAMTWEDAHEIIKGADYDGSLRPQLLKACRLA